MTTNSHLIRTKSDRTDRRRSPRRGARTGAVAVTATLALAGLGLLIPPSAQAAACTGDPTAIGAIQGSADTPAITGTVTVRGVVVGDNEGSSPALQGFFLQDSGDGDATTSDGIFVYDPGSDQVEVGDEVELTGTVTEYQGQTEIAGVSAWERCASGRSVTPTTVRLPLASADALERYESMLVRLPQKLTVTEHYLLSRFGQVTVSAGGRLRQPTNLYPADDPRAAALQARNDLNQLIVDDALNDQNPDPIVLARGESGTGENELTATNTLRTGDTVQGAVGVMTYTWGGNSASPNAWRLRPVGALGGQARFRPANQRPTTSKVAGTLSVASSNVLNYFNTLDGCTGGVEGAAMDCRGAETAAELERQTAKEVASLVALDADVIGLMEIENDGYGADSAIAELTDALNAATAPGTYAYVDADARTGVVDVAGSDAIKVGMLYRPAVVTPTNTLVDQDEVFERNPLAVTFRQKKGGGVLSVVVNHFKSKSCTDATGADTDQGDGQSCYNAHRVEQADTLAGWIDSDLVPAAGDRDVLIIGDLNAYAKEDPILALADAGYADMAAAKIGVRSAYSYVYDGQAGYLDQALASSSLRAQVREIEDVHTNADEPSALDYNTNYKSADQLSSLYAADRYRASDHDPVLIGLKLRK